jgi:hypothetical protein
MSRGACEPQSHGTPPTDFSRNAIIDPTDAMVLVDTIVQWVDLTASGLIRLLF